MLLVKKMFTNIFCCRFNFTHSPVRTPASAYTPPLSSRSRSPAPPLPRLALPAPLASEEDQLVQALHEFNFKESKLSNETITHHINLNGSGMFAPCQSIAISAYPFRLKGLYNDQKTGRTDVVALLLKSDCVDALLGPEVVARILDPPNDHIIRFTCLKWQKAFTKEVRNHCNGLCDRDSRFPLDLFDEHLIQFDDKDLLAEVQHRDFVFNTKLNNASFNFGLSTAQKAKGQLMTWPGITSAIIDRSDMPLIDKKAAIKFGVWIIAGLSGTETNFASDDQYKTNHNIEVNKSLQLAMENGKYRW